MSGGLERFATAQDAVWPEVEAELAAGRKTSHWMWFVFPQLAGIGRSPTARHFAIGSLAEARAYLAHPLLRHRLLLGIDLMMRHRGEPPEAVLGRIDAAKLRSCLTLFERAEPAEPRFAAALDALYAGERDGLTLDLLAREAGRRGG